MEIEQSIMTDMTDKVVVVGLGVTGLSVVRYLRRKNIVPVVIDSRNNPPGKEELKSCYPEVEMVFGDYNKDQLASAKQLVVSPGVAISLPEISHARAQGVEVVGDVELFAREVNQPVIAITGSNGKSTVTTLVGEIINNCNLKAGVGGNIGMPVLDLLDEGYDVYVLELSSFQLETTRSLKAESSVILNISEDHLDRYSGIQEYIDAKSQIYAGSKNCIINLDDAVVANMSLDCDSVTGFTLGASDEEDFGVVSNENGSWIVHEDKKVVDINKLFISGLHNVANVMAALALIQSFKLQSAKVVEAIYSFAGLPHRMQCVAIANEIEWIDDSKATNVGAAEAAIYGLGKNIILIAGGESKEADLSPLREPVDKHVHTLVLIGRDAPLLETVCTGVTEIIHASCMFDAVVKAKEKAKPGDKVLLSPACASFDMFDNFVHRGNVFKDAVKAVLS